MKKVTSAALLAIKLSWVAALSMMLAGVVAQVFSVYQWLMPGGVPLQASFGFETLLRSAVQGAGQWFMLLLLVFLTLSTASTKGSRTVYTMNRLGLSEIQMSLVFGLVFTLYFLLYWAFQLGLCYAFFVWYTRFGLVSSNAFMLAAWRSKWLHTLLPLGEWWGYLRNLAICGSFGFSAAFGSQLSRHGKLPLASLAPPLLCAVLLNGQIGSFGLDIVLTVLLAAFPIGYFFMLKGGCEDEDL